MEYTKIRAIIQKEYDSQPTDTNYNFISRFAKAIYEAQQEEKDNGVQTRVRFELPSDEQMISIAILFNDGKLEQGKLTDMVGYGNFIVDRLYENGNVAIPSSKEDSN